MQPKTLFYRFYTFFCFEATPLSMRDFGSLLLAECYFYDGTANRTAAAVRDVSASHSNNYFAKRRDAAYTNYGMSL